MTAKADTQTVLAQTQAVQAQTQLAQAQTTQAAAAPAPINTRCQTDAIITYHGALIILGSKPDATPDQKAYYALGLQAAKHNKGLLAECPQLKP